MLRAAFVVLALCGGCTVGGDPSGGTGGGGGGSGGGGGGGGGGGTGGGFTAKDTIGAVVTLDGDTSAHIVIANTTNLCTDAGASPAIDRELQKFIVIDLTDVGASSTSAPSSPGTYTIYSNSGSRPAKSASYVTGAFDAACLPVDTADASGQSGSIVLTTAGAQFSGTYDVTLNDDSHVTGSFSSTACPALQAAVTSTQHACKP